MRRILEHRSTPWRVVLEQNDPPRLILAMKTYEAGLSIKAWAEEDRPREKLMLKGKNHLTDAELLAILLGSGSRDESVVTLSQRILIANSNNLRELSRRSLKELMGFKGIGEAKALIIAAALELGRRLQHSDLPDRPQIKCSRDAYQLMIPFLTDIHHEEFWVLLLNRANAVVHRQRISTGGISGTTVDARIIFKSAVEHLASGVILCHNHPSGNLRPSQADIDITKKLKQAGELLEVSVLDHLIVTDAGFYSFADEGML